MLPNCIIFYTTNPSPRHFKNLELGTYHCYLVKKGTVRVLMWLF